MEFADLGDLYRPSKARERARRRGQFAFSDVAAPEAERAPALYRAEDELGWTQVERVCVGDGASAWIVRERFEQPVTVNAAHSGTISFSVMLRGAFQSGQDGGRALNLVGPAVFAAAHPLRSRSYTMLRGMEYEYISLRFASLAALCKIGLPVSVLPPRFLEVVNQREGEAAFFIGGADRQTLRAAGEMIQPPVRGALRQLFIAAKARELICHILNADRLAETLDQANQLASADNRRLAELARASIRQDPSRRFSVDELARELGVRPNRLMRAFKTAFGTTLQEFSRAERLDKARSLLCEDQYSITAIAQMAGYGQHSTFTTAYKERFGEAPSATRAARSRRPSND